MYLATFIGRRITISTESGRRLNIRVAKQGERYGQHGCCHNTQPDPWVECFAADRAGPWHGPLGSFEAAFRLSELGHAMRHSLDSTGMEAIRRLAE